MLAPYGGRVSIDIGAGDGRYAYASARRDAARFFVAIDANASALAATSHKTLRKTAKGGLGNALFVAAPVEALPDELAGVADRVTVLFPWSSLLRAVAAPDVELLANVRGLCRTGATLEVVLGYDCERERTQVDRLALPELTEEYLTRELPPRYRDAGFRVQRVEALTHEALRALPSTWAKRLAFGRPRDVWRIVAKAE